MQEMIKLDFRCRSWTKKIDSDAWFSEESDSDSTQKTLESLQLRSPCDKVNTLGLEYLCHVT